MAAGNHHPVNGMRGGSDYRKDIAEKRVLPAEVILECIAKADSENDFDESVWIAQATENHYLSGSVQDQKEAKVRIARIKRRLIAAHPDEGIKITDGGLFWSVCCSDLEDAIFDGGVESVIDSDGEPGLMIRDHVILARMQNTDDTDYPESYFIGTNQCPFCGEIMHGCTVDGHGNDIVRIRRR